MDPSYRKNDNFSPFRAAKSLRILHLESSRQMTDSAVSSLLQDNPLKDLEVSLLIAFFVGLLSEQKKNNSFLHILKILTQSYI